eukprot:scaffold6432_cov107-Isochrysis_galbana.AAC.5
MAAVAMPPPAEWMEQTHTTQRTSRLPFLEHKTNLSDLAGLLMRDVCKMLRRVQAGVEGAERHELAAQLSKMAATAEGEAGMENRLRLSHDCRSAPAGQHSGPCRLAISVHTG